MAVNNHFHVIGRLGKDPQAGETKNGNPKCTFSVAADRIGSGKGEDKVTDWFFITLYGKNAENALKMLAKGSLVAIEGRIETYKKDDGTSGSVVAGSQWQLLSGGKDRDDSDGEASASAPADDDIPF